VAAELKIYSNSACAIELTGTPYELDLGDLDGTNGETYITSILVKNTGNATNSSVVLTETSDVDARVQYSLDDIAYHQTTITLGDMDAGEIVRVYIKVTVATDTDTHDDEPFNFTIAGASASKSVAGTYSITTILDTVKTALRISNTAYDDEIDDLIDAAKADLQLSGLLGEKILLTDALIKRAVVTYCKANFGWNNPDAERLQQSYDMLKNHMSLSQDYAYYAVTFVVKNSSNVAIDEAEITFNGTTKYTNALGIAIFYIRSGDNYQYEISADGYQDYVDSDGNNYNVDVSASSIINITMVAS
jgi:hypothetical protein